MGHTSQLSNKWKLLLWPVCLVTFLLFNVTYPLVCCCLCVTRIPNSQRMAAPGTWSNVLSEEAQGSVPLVTRWWGHPSLSPLLFPTSSASELTLEPPALNFFASRMTVEAAAARSAGRSGLMPVLCLTEGPQCDYECASEFLS